VLDVWRLICLNGSSLLSTKCCVSNQFKENTCYDWKISTSKTTQIQGFLLKKIPLKITFHQINEIRWTLKYVKVHGNVNWFKQLTKMQ
jgi:hypothetical protein